jgi:hypothetical protein
MGDSIQLAPTDQVQSIQFHDDLARDATLLQFYFVDGRDVTIAMLREQVVRFEADLMASLTRCAILRGQSSGAPPAPLLHEPYGSGPACVLGPPRTVLAHVVDAVDWHEVNGGHTLVIVFRHRATATQVHMPSSEAKQLLDSIRRRIALN